MHLIAFLWSLAACDGGDVDTKDLPPLPVDADGDGSNEDEDCDDGDAEVFPDATEKCDGKDNDCDADIDEDGTSDGTLYYADADGDQYGSPTATVRACAAPAGYVADNTDCDDADGGVSPAATEVCNDVDDNCVDGADEAGADGAPAWYADTDGDGFGDAGETTAACNVPLGYVDDATDCDDSRADISPAATEYCNTVDDNCDGHVDEEGADGSITSFRDADGDGYGDANFSIDSCEPPDDYVSNYDDCDDTDALVNPLGVEVCNGIDDDCEGSIDGSDALDPSTWYLDSDGDAHGDAASVATACDQPYRYVATSDDCDDTSATVYTGAPEVCDFIDENCDGTLDDGFDYYYADADADGFGSDSASPGCTADAGTVADNSDCDDSSEWIYPGAVELCDAQRNDCDMASWTASDEDGTVSLFDAAGAWSDLTATWSAGTDGAPTSITLPTDGTVLLCDGTYYVSLLVESGRVALQARNTGGATLDGGGVSQILDVRGGRVEVTGLSLRHGYAATGGAISSFGTVVLDACTLSDNTATDAGGAIHTDAGSTLQIYSSVLADNTSDYTGGAINAYSATAELTDTTVSGNYAADAGGGAVVQEGTFSFEDSVFEGNSTGGHGGGIYVWSGYASCTGTSGARSGLLANTAGSDGGALHVLDGAVFTATTCDLGVSGSSDDNVDATGFSDVWAQYGGTYAYEDDASFTCRYGYCE